MYKIKFKNGTVKEFETLNCADLRGADLSYANLRNADLSVTDLRGVNLRGANLSRADLSNADLRDADLRSAFLNNADLRGADLRGTDLRGITSLRAVNLTFCKGVISFTAERHLGIYFKCKGKYYVKIGCRCLPIETWIKHYKRIGKESFYDKGAIEFYGDLFTLLNKYDLN